MSSRRVRRLERRKWRLTDRLRRSDFRWERWRGRKLEKRLIRAQLYRLDLLLEREGYFG